jgi:uncharacterized protein
MPTSTCLPFAKKLYLTVQNKLLPCEKISHKFYLGKVNENMMIDFQSVAAKWNSYLDRFKKQCQHCYAYKFCGICLFTLTNPDKLDEESVCNYFYDQKAFSVKLYHIFSFLEKYPNDFFYILKNITIT